LHTKTPHNFWIINQNGMIQSFLRICNSWKTYFKFLFMKKWFFIYLACPAKEKSNILGHNFWLIFPNVMKFSAHERYSSFPPYFKILSLKYANLQLQVPTQIFYVAKTHFLKGLNYYLFYKKQNWFQVGS